MWPSLLQQIFNVKEMGRALRSLAYKPPHLLPIICVPKCHVQRAVLLSFPLCFWHTFSLFPPKQIWREVKKIIISVTGPQSNHVPWLWAWMLSCFKRKMTKYTENWKKKRIYLQFWLKIWIETFSTCPSLPEWCHILQKRQSKTRV